MAALTRKRVNDRPETCHIHFAGVRVGLIMERSGIANTVEPWEWHCGFYPGSRPGDDRYGRAADFEAALPHLRRHGANTCQTAPRPTFGHGVIKRSGPRRSIAALIDISPMPPDWRARGQA